MYATYKCQKYLYIKYIYFDRTVKFRLRQDPGAPLGFAFHVSNRSNTMTSGNVQVTGRQVAAGALGSNQAVAARIQISTPMIEIVLARLTYVHT